jgi:hypothetical protein
LLLGGVVAEFVSLGPRQNAKERRIAVCNPKAEGKSADEDGDASEDAAEKVEGAHGPDTDEVEKTAFYAQVGERLMQALEDAIYSESLFLLFWHKPFEKCCDVGEFTGVKKDTLDTPQPGQDIGREDGNTCTGGNTGESFFGAGFPVREAITADNDRNQTCYLGDGACEEGLNGGEAGVEGRAALGMSDDRKEEKNKSGRPEISKHFANLLDLSLGDCESDSDLHLPPPTADESVVIWANLLRLEQAVQYLF